MEKHVRVLLFLLRNVGFLLGLTDFYDHFSSRVCLCTYCYSLRNKNTLKQHKIYNHGGKKTTTTLPLLKHAYFSVSSRRHQTSGQFNCVCGKQSCGLASWGQPHGSQVAVFFPLRLQRGVFCLEAQKEPSGLFSSLTFLTSLLLLIMFFNSMKFWHLGGSWQARGSLPLPRAC